MPVCLWAKDSVPNPQELSFFETLKNVMKICKHYLESEYGADLASTLSSPFYYKQEEYIDKKGKKKTRIDESSAPVLYEKNLFIQKNQRKFFLCLRQRERMI